MEHQLNEIIEALLLSASRPVSIEEIEKVFVENPPSREEIRNSLNEIEENCLNRGIELKKVSWPTKQETTQTAMGVIVIVVIIGILLWLLDMLLAWSIGTLYGVR